MKRTPRDGAREMEQARHALAATSARAYASDWSAFSSWCLLRGVQPLPATIADVIEYFQSLLPAGRVSTLRRKLVSIARHHRMRGHPFPSRDARVLEFFRGAVTSPAARITPRGNVDAGLVEILVSALPATIGGIRDRALILVGWTLGCRPSELVGLDSGDVRVQASSILVTVRPRGEPTELRMRAVGDTEVCPVRWLKAWLSVSHMADGPVFRPVTRFGRVLAHRMTAQSVRLLLKRAALRAGLQPRTLTGDSLRSKGGRPPARQIAT